MRRNRNAEELLDRAETAEASRAATERVVARLQKRVAELERANRNLEEFAYLASHDLKEPLRGLRMYCELLAADNQEKLDGEAIRQLQAMMTMCDRLSSLIDGVLGFCLAGQLPSSGLSADLDVVVQEAVQLLRPTILHRHGEVVVANRLPVVIGDSGLLGMVFGNLISNGLKFNESTSPRVEIGCLESPKLTIYVRDNGIGIASEHHEDIFALFRRLHGRKKYEGSGVGLAIVRKIIEAHGGRVWLQSEPGRGSTFFFSLQPCLPAAGKMTIPSPHWNHRDAACDAERTAAQPEPHLSGRDTV